MPSRTIVDSVEPVSGPPAHLPDVEDEIAALRVRFPGAIIDRYLHHVPQIGSGVHVAAGAALVGQVTLASDVSIWYGCVLRADINRIEVRERSNIQDGTVVHLGDDDGTFVAEEVVVGHRAVLHGCHIGGGSLIGIQATILDGARIGEGSVVGAGALVTAGSVIPPRSLVLGMPAKVIKALGADDEAFHRKLALKYLRLSHNYRVG
ncbi:MAG TPA: gamma carbonic anhydrase family protein [Polyangiaceae bacterium]|nr:gamma carbonic anhydrase family protein [Polyangiaceae bacterium]